jgi:serine/threonine protein kinase/tetratricopeptide (TPR) repeat protein
MAEGHHDRLSELFAQAVELSPEARTRFLETCSDDPAIRFELQSLLAAHDRAPNLLERLAGEVVPAALQAVVENDQVSGRAVRRERPIISTPEQSGAGCVAVTIAPGARLGAYEVQGRIAAGGIGVVYRAFDTVLQRSVAIKTLGWSTPDARDALLREARAASALNHPHICTIHEVGEHEGIPFIAMEYIDGRTLHDLIPRDHWVAESIVRYGTQVAQAVEYAHRHGLIHRDLKSANVMVSAEGHVKVLDFGLANRMPAADMETLTRTRVASHAGALAGTLAYLAPELLRGTVADKRTDVWALGVLLYEMAAGRLPFQGATALELMAAILDGTPPPLPAKVPMPLRAVIGRCVARDPALRYQDAGEVRVALETLQPSTEPSLIGRDESSPPLGWVLRWRARLLIAGIAALVLAGAVGVRLFNTKRTLALTDRDTLLIADFLNSTGDNVFDRTLKQALSIHLGQSPFLGIVSREEERAALRMMTKSSDDRLAGADAREACQRIGAKALIEGSIAPLGSHYVIGLEAVNCQSGATIGSEQAEASGREQVLIVLGPAASRLRRKLGESLPTIERFDKPMAQATTSSLEALRAFSAAEDIRSRTGEFGAVPFYKRAIELDPDFALAYARLSAIYGNLGQSVEARRNAEEAYSRRDRVTERERFYIDGRHCALRGDPECFRDVNELWKRTYPRDGRPYGSLSDFYFNAVMCDKAMENAATALRLEPSQAAAYLFVAGAYLCLEKPAEARQTLQQAISRQLENPFIYHTLFRAAFYDGDDRTMTRVREWASGQPEESLFKELDSDAAAFDGQMRRSRELRLRAEQLAALRLKERVMTIRARGAFYEAAQGDFQRARQTVNSVAAESPPASLTPHLLAAAVLARDYEQADALLRGREPLKQGPPALLDSVVRVLREVAAGDRSAIARLPPASARELSQGQFRPVYVRGLTYLHVGDGEKAAAEFQRIVDHRGLEPTSPLYPLAYVQLARAHAFSGDHVKARKSYQDFLALWKDADPDIPILRKAKTEYARLSPQDNRRPH